MKKDMLEQIKQDISLFADIGTEILIDHDLATWSQRGKNMSVELSHGEYYPNIKYNNMTYSYKDFFASAVMADLKSLAHSMLHILPKHETNFVDSHAKLVSYFNTSTDDSDTSTNLLNREAYENLPFNKTKLLFIKGEAGLGKTYVLQHLTRASAEKYISGSNNKLFLYIDAQTKSLSDLDDVAAKLLSDLQARFYYNALPLLTRLQLIVPIIDGFDELIGVGGYGDAFESLTRFMSKLNGEGVIIASARSTFIEYKGIRNKASRYESLGDIDYQLSEVELLHWREEEIVKYISNRTKRNQTEASDFYKNITSNIAPSEFDLLKVPFFLSTIVDIVLDQKEYRYSSNRLINQIVDFFIDREAKKLRNKTGSLLLQKDAHYAFLKQIAEEMWWTESNEVDLNTIRLAAEIFADSFIDNQADRKIFIEKSPTYAFWRASNKNQGRFNFSHEYYYSFFTARYLFGELTESSDINPILNKALINDTIATELSYIAKDNNAQSKIMSNIATRELPFITNEINSENAGNIIHSIFVLQPEVLDCNISNTVFTSKNFTGITFKNCQFNKTKFNECNLTDTTLLNCLFNDVILYKPTLSTSGTDFGGMILDFQSIFSGCIIHTSSDTVELYNPSDIAAYAKELHINTTIDKEYPKPKNLSKYNLAKKFLKIANRLFYISDDDLIKCGIKTNQEWKQIESSLISHNLLQFISIDKRGHQSKVRKLTHTPEIIQQGEINSENGDVKLFWTDIYK